MKELDKYNENGFTVDITFVHNDKDIEISFSIKDKDDLVAHLSTPDTATTELTKNLFDTMEYRDMLVAISKVIQQTSKAFDAKNKGDK